MAQNRIRVAAAVFKRLREADNGIPENVLAKAKAVAIFPTISNNKGFWQRRFRSEGVVSRRFGVQGWTAPAFFELVRSTSSGIRHSPSTVVLIFNEDSAVDKLRQGEVKLSEGDSIVQGPTKANGLDLALSPPGIDILYYEYVEGVAVVPNLRDLVLKPNNVDSRGALGYKAEEILFYEKEAALKNLSKHETLLAFTSGLNALPPNYDITPKINEFFDAGNDFPVGKSLEEIKQYVKVFLNSEELRYREEPTDAGVVITAFLDLNEVTMRHRRAAFLIHIMRTNEQNSCLVSLKLHVSSKGYREKYYRTLNEDTKLSDLDPRIRGKVVDGEEVSLKQYVKKIGDHIRSL